MRINIDNKIINDYDISLSEYLYLLIRNNINEIKTSLIKKGIINENNDILNEKIEKCIQSTIRTKNAKFVIPQRLMNLADKLIVLYPRGIKPNTNTPWRGSKIEIATKLTTLEELFGIVIDDEIAINATKKYISTFINDKTMMQTLKYFILKQIIKDGLTEYKSEILAFMDMIKDGVETQQNNSDWIGELK